MDNANQKIRSDSSDKESVEKEHGKELYELFVDPAKCQAKNSKISKKVFTPPSVTKKRKYTEEDPRPRTPSGQVITKTIGVLKYMLQQQGIGYSESDHDNPPPKKLVTLPEFNERRHSTGTIKDIPQSLRSLKTTNTSLESLSANQTTSEKTCYACEDPTIEETASVNTSENCELQTSLAQAIECETAFVDFKRVQMASGNATPNIKGPTVASEEIKDDGMGHKVTDAEETTGMEQVLKDHATIDVRTVLEMFKQLRVQIQADVKTEIRAAIGQMEEKNDTSKQEEKLKNSQFNSKS